MEFILKNSNLSLESEKKSILLQSDKVILDELAIEMAGEYEKGGFLAYAHEEAGNRLYQIRVEGDTVGYIASLRTDLSTTELEFLGDIDVLVMPTSKSSVSLLEKIEPRMLVTYGETAHELATAMGVSGPPVAKYKVKEADMSNEKMGVVVMGE